MTRKRAAVAVISKLPREGRTKTRLARTLGAQAALDLHRAFLLDELDQLGRPDRWDLYLVHDAPDTESGKRDMEGLLAGAGARSLVPGRPGLQEELLAAFGLLLEGHDRVLVVSGDVPQIDASAAARALALLDDADLVLGPGPDGGYWGVGLRSPHDVFTPIRMGAGPVRSATIALAQSLGLRVALAEPLQDIDEAQDLLVLGRAAEGLAGRTRALAAGLARTDVAPQLPSELQVEASSRCNLGCSACARTGRSLAPDADLSFSSFHRIVDSLPLLRRVGFMLNGESLLNCDLPAMVRLAADRGATTVLNTNGTLLDGRHRAALLDCGLHELRVSLNGATRETVARMAGADVLPEILAGVRALATERGASPRPAIGLWMVAARSTIAELPDLVRLAARVGAPEVYLQRLVVTGRGAATEEESVFGSVDAGMLEAIARAEELAGSLGVALRASGRQPLADSLRPSPDPVPQLGCWRPWRSAAVTASCRVLPCCISSFVAPYDDLEMGDLSRQSWEEVWNGDRYRALRTGILGGDPLPWCAGCGVRWSL